MHIKTPTMLEIMDESLMGAADTSRIESSVLRSFSMTELSEGKSSFSRLFPSSNSKIKLLSRQQAKRANKQKMYTF